MPSSVSAQRLSGASTTSAPQTAWSYPPATYGRERVLARVAERTVPAVVAERDRLGERDVEPTRPRDAGGHLRDLERMGEAGALVVLREDEHLRLAREAAEGRRAVEDAVTVPLEAGAPFVGLLRRGAMAARRAPGWRPVRGAPSSDSSRATRSNRRPGRAWRRRPRGRAGPGRRRGRPSCRPTAAPARSAPRSRRDPTDRVRHRRRSPDTPLVRRTRPLGPCCAPIRGWASGGGGGERAQDVGAAGQPVKWSSPGHVTTRASGSRAASIVAHRAGTSRSRSPCQSVTGP